MIVIEWELKTLIHSWISIWRAVLTIIPALEGAKKPPAVDTNEECEQEEEREDPVQKDNEGGNALSGKERNEGGNDLLGVEGGEAGKDIPKEEELVLGKMRMWILHKRNKNVVQK